jgi:tetratricopeptide (TPR) repeat protein
LRRQRGADGRVLGDTGSFEVSSAPEDALALANAVTIHLPRVFAGHAARSAEARFDVRGADYQHYLRIRLRNEGGQILGAAEIDELLQIVRSSPGLTEAELLAGSTARSQSDPRAEQILREAEARHPGDPRFVYERLLLANKNGAIPAAESALRELERQAPGDIRVWRGRALIASQQGRLQEAAEALTRMVTLRPSWRNLWYLADVELKMGDATNTRRHLEQLLALSPRNPRGMAKMAELEWVMGDPAVAARIYQDLLTRTVTQESLGNLGWSLLLAGDYPAAVAACQRALDRNAGDLLSRLNLGIAHEGTGDAAAARLVYQELLDRLAAQERTQALGGLDLLTRAQALARLGDAVAAVDITARVLAAGNRDVQFVYRAAVIYAVCGERTNAIVHAREARRRGLSARWFTIPGFEPLRASPEFRELLDPRASAPPPGTS